MMQQTVSQLPLEQRIPSLQDGVRSLRAQRESLDRQEADLMELLAQAERELKGQSAAEQDRIRAALAVAAGAPPAPAPAPKAGST
jgi:hypothetical protein